MEKINIIKSNIKNYSPEFLKDILSIEKDNFSDYELIIRASVRLEYFKKTRVIK
jgi:hypothetical protein